MKLNESQKLFERAQKSLAGGVSSHFRALDKPIPQFFEKANGANIWDADGNKYTDFALSQGPMILGHSPAPVLKAVTEEMKRGQLFAGQHVPEIELAELIQKHVPCADLTRFSLTGSEATQTAIRVARAYTGRKKYIKFEGQYHGWFDSTLISVAPPKEVRGPLKSPIVVGMTKGQTESVLEEAIVLPWNNLAALKRTVKEREKEVAGIIMEPVMCNCGCIPPKPGYLEGVRNLCDKKDIPLIFDEIITGFRCALGGAQAHYGVTPDIATFGKAMAAGFPISAISGTRKFMDLIANGEVMHAGTFNSYNIGIAASLATTRLMAENRQEVHRRIRRNGKALMSGIRRIARKQNKPLLVQGLGPMFHVGFTPKKEITSFRDCDSYDAARYGQVVSAMRERGVRLIGRGIWYVSAAHTEKDVEKTLAMFEEVIRNE